MITVQPAKITARPTVASAVITAGAARALCSVSR